MVYIIESITPTNSEANMTMTSYVADELNNKVFQLHKALNQAHHIISLLEEENNSLKDALNNLASENKEDYTNLDYLYGGCC